MDTYTVLPAPMSIWIVVMLLWATVMWAAEKRKRIGRLGVLDGLTITATGVFALWFAVWIARTWTSL